MKLFEFAILLLVQLSPIYVPVYGEAVSNYICQTPQSSDVTVRDAGAQLTKGCALNSNDIKFDIKAMYGKDPTKTSVKINISEADFLNSYIKLINSDNIPDTQVPLLFTMSKSNMKGTFGLEFGSDGKVFKMPPNSRISIVDSKLDFSKTISDEMSYLFTFHGLQLVTSSSMEIAHNVITMECTGCDGVVIFNIPEGIEMMISNKSSFSLHGNTITMKGQRNRDSNIMQSVWLQITSPLTVSQSSNYTWAMNNISMDVNNVKSTRQIPWHGFSSITISILSRFIFETNRILMLAKDYESNNFQSYVFLLEDSTVRAKCTISGGSSMVWKDNCVGMGHKEVDKRYVLGGKWS
eukprot:Tbor_TRINITY_DN6004_c0_g1::TRINITY_DN6004_c0_g1_i4::g.10175::m.10175